MWEPRSIVLVKIGLDRETSPWSQEMTPWSQRDEHVVTERRTRGHRETPPWSQRSDPVVTEKRPRGHSLHPPPHQPQHKHTHTTSATQHSTDTTRCKQTGLGYLDDSSLVHGDAVLRVLGQLEEGPGRGAVHVLVLGLEVAHQGRHGTLLPEGDAVVAPVAAAGNGFRQMAPQFVGRLWTYRRKDSELFHVHI